MKRSLVMAMVTVLVAAPCGAGAPEDSPLGSLKPLIGRWISRLDEHYRNHPMIQRFNPDLKSNELVFEWGAQGKVLRTRTLELDRPAEGDRRLVIEGLALWDPVQKEIVFVEYNADQQLLFRGTYSAAVPGELHRIYDASFPDGSMRRFREIWRWQGEGQSAFEWITQHQEDGRWVSGEIVVGWELLDR